MLTTRRWAVVVACSLPLLLAGCSAHAVDLHTDVAPVLPAKASSSAPPDTTVPGSDPVPVTITGTVLSRAGRPTPGATISVRPASTSRDCLTCGSAFARTDRAGRFELVLTRGNYLLTCSEAGGAVCRIEGDAVPGSFAVTSASRDLVLTVDRAVDPRAR